MGELGEGVSGSADSDPGAEPRTSSTESWARRSHSGQGPMFNEVDNVTAFGAEVDPKIVTLT